LLEHGSDDIYELLDLRIAKCRLMVAELANNVRINGNKPLKVATKFVNIARQYYAQKGEQVQLIKLYGSMELAPIVNLADKIVDVVDTGKTLEANGLIASEHIADISTRLIVNGATYRREHEQVKAIAHGIRMLLNEGAA